jgi:hypothetical protein
MQAGPPPQPVLYPQPPRPGWGRFWLGALAGGCGVLLLEAVALGVVLLVVGSAITGAVRQVGNGGLPGGLPAPSGLPGLSQSSDPCSPQPCMAHSGLTVLVGGLDRSAGPASDGRSHLVRLTITFVDTTGSHTVTPEEVAIRDSTGGMTLAGVDQAAAGCGDANVSADVEAGQRAGPYTVCYAVAGTAGTPLTLVWIDPEDLSIVELKLP